MRTTLEIDDDVMLASSELARHRNQGIGRAISDLVRRGLVPEAAPVIEMKNGIPMLKHGPAAIAVTSEMVRNLLDEE